MAMPPLSLRDRLSERGYDVLGVDLAPFILSGGGAFCMTLRLDLKSVVACADGPRRRRTDGQDRRYDDHDGRGQTRPHHGHDRLLALEAEYGARNYKPLDVVLTRGEGVYVWDVDGAAISTPCRPIPRSIKATATRASARRLSPRRTA